MSRETSHDPIAHRHAVSDIEITAPGGGPLFTIALLALFGGISFTLYVHSAWQPTLLVGAPCLLLFLLICKGLVTLQPNESLVCLLFGRYVGTLQRSGWWWVNPFYSLKRVSRRLMTLESGKLKVNDAVGNPVDIGAVVVWRVEDAARALLEVRIYKDYVQAQTEAALRRLASLHPYDHVEAEAAHKQISDITLRDGGDAIIGLFLGELRARMAAIGVAIIEARISHLAYSPEIAGAMLRVQAAGAVLSARRMVVRGAVEIVAETLTELENRNLLQSLDSERKAAMVSNLLVVLVGDQNVAPVINTGSLYS